MRTFAFAVALNALFAAFGLLGPSVQTAEASTDVAVVISSALPSRVTVTTGTVIRIDNWNNNAQSGAMGGQPRIGVCFTNHDAADDIYYGFTTSVSTHAGSGIIGHILASRDLVCVGALRAVPIYAIAVDAAGAAGAVISTTQLAKE